ncbi:MAG TPA: putative porin [Gammaproteobacteria bacterium]
MRNTLAAAFVATSFACATPVGAQPSAGTEIAAIRAELAALSARLERLEQAGGAVAVAAPAPAPAAATALVVEEPRAAAVPPNVQFSGDLRYRHEAINEEGSTERERQRIRARFGVAADVAQNVRVGLTLATGNDDPVSANQSLDTGFSRKAIGVDRAFFSWAATEQLTFTGGKMANPFFRPGNHHLIYDNDLNPEGLALRYSRANWFANYAGLWVEERAAADDSIMLGGQVGYRRALDGGRRVTAGVGYYDYRATQSQTPFFDGVAAGNRVDAAGHYLSDFNLLQLFGELNLKAGERPLTLFADYARNTEADDFDAGYALGVALGEVTRPGTWRIGYAYQDLEADAVIGAFTDSDWSGGGTDGRGHVVEFNYGFRDRLVFGFRYFLNDKAINAGNEHDYNRLQADVQFNY